MTSNPVYKNLLLIKKTLTIRVFTIAIAIAAPCLIFGQTTIATSIILGSIFSYFAFNNMLLSQSLILQKRSKGAFFIPLLLRLLIYAIPMVLAIVFTDYLNLWTTLIFLWIFQIGYVILELVRSIKNIKKRAKK